MNLFRYPLFALALIATTSLTACQRDSRGSTASATVSADTWAVVDGRQITRDDVEKAFRRTQGGTEPTLSDEEAMAAKLTILNELIVQDLLLAKAQALKVELPEADLDKAFTDAKQNIPDDAFQKELSRRNLTAGDMREGLRRELLTQKVIEQEIGSKISVSDQEITDFFNANKPQFNFPEEAYHLAQIVVTPVRDQIANRSGDDAATPQAAEAKVRMLMERLKSGVSFRELAADFSEDADSAPRGGDIGFVPASRIRQAPPVMRDAVLNKEAGSVNVVSTGGAHTIVLVVAHEQAGQRDLSTPGVRENITETIRGRKEQLMRAAYLTAIRSDADVENHLARRLVESQGKLPALQPSAPR
jgi:peptidyl-prolyl cis-trans isomerase SurA